MKKLVSMLLIGAMLALTGCGAAAEAPQDAEAVTETESSTADSTVTIVKEDAEADSEVVAAVTEAEENAVALESTYENVAYATGSDAQVCDIYLPEGTAPFPVMVVIHGGAFALGSKTDENIMKIVDASVAHGYATVSIEYRKNSEANFPGAVADTKGAIRFIKANAKEYGFDEDDITIWGVSAGGYLAAMTALTGNVAELSADVYDYEGYDSDVQAIVDYFGPIHFTEQEQDFEELGITPGEGDDLISFLTAFMGFDMNGDINKANESWWGVYVDRLPEDLELKVWISHGISDMHIPYTQSVHFAEDLKTILPEEDIHLELFEGEAHSSDVYYTPENLEKVFLFLEE